MEDGLDPTRKEDYLNDAAFAKVNPIPPLSSPLPAADVQFNLYYAAEHHALI